MQQTWMKAADPGVVSFCPTSETEGTIHGTHPISWSGDYQYKDGELRIKGHFPLSGRVEQGIMDKLLPALLEMRTNGPQAA